MIEILHITVTSKSLTEPKILMRVCNTACLTTAASSTILGQRLRVEKSGQYNLVKLLTNHSKRTFVWEMCDEKDYGRHRMKCYCIDGPLPTGYYKVTGVEVKSMQQYNLWD
ncbi:hypothetical protein QKD27_gp3 [Wenling tonguesole paramyxovirus]|uniref:Uncharacterized protein n=1 Tax=Wenling tonguesole paramyxovirus TaxID=2116454 RepID=A0A2P1GMZ7_9MONO|nr:hypothetical protein QKD27_gp3 [Wenling tonguesole paramyxovirus]AVM87372.1 hypothetical protein [Wenling tonguesole paramyxovirus]